MNELECINKAAARTGISVATLMRRLQEAGLSQRGVPTVLKASRWDDLASQSRSNKPKAKCKHCDREVWSRGMCQRCKYRTDRGIPLHLPSKRSKLCVECNVRTPTVKVIEDNSRLCTQCFFELNTPRNAPANTNARNRYANCGT